MRRPNRYAATEIDRAAELRRDEAWLEEKLGDPASRIVPVWRNQNLVVEGAEAPEPAAVPVSPDALALGDVPVLLGLWNGIAHFSIDVSPEEDAPFTEFGEYRDLREVGPLMGHEAGALLAYARGMSTWQRRHMFCGRCGHPNESREAGHVRVCSNPECGAPCFPRTDPAVIMLIHDGADRLILGRQSVWRKGQHSVLAGFVEPGESLEDAVAREVFEEVGVRIDDVTYHSSQPWPFPSSIMLGFYGRATGTELKVNLGELEAAAWFSRDEIANSPETDAFRLPRKDSISRRLIEDWIEEG